MLNEHSMRLIFLSTKTRMGGAIRFRPDECIGGTDHIRQKGN